ncbi:hypothetical protein C8R43DRAFT_942803 [Mycena crocata]|nr:hypothetical protein C8R43DRAFT_942803 [Mycena crocata]
MKIDLPNPPPPVFQVCVQPPVSSPRVVTRIQGSRFKFTGGDRAWLIACGVIWGKARPGCTRRDICKALAERVATGIANLQFLVRLIPISNSYGIDRDIQAALESVPVKHPPPSPPPASADLPDAPQPRLENPRSEPSDPWWRASDNSRLAHRIVVEPLFLPPVKREHSPCVPLSVDNLASSPVQRQISRRVPRYVAEVASDPIKREVSPPVLRPAPG